MNEAKPNLNPTGELEARLRGWTPRGPSPALERRLFPVTDRQRPGNAARFWQLAAPTAAGLLALMVLTNEPGPAGAMRPGQEGASKTIGLWGAQLPVESLARMNLGRNVFAVFRGPAFDWTNRSDSPSTSGSFSLPMTNSL